MAEQRACRTYHVAIHLYLRVLEHSFQSHLHQRRLLRRTACTVTDAFLFDSKKMFIVPTNVDAGMRPLKVVFEGDVFSTEATNIDDLSFEVRLDQYFGAGIAKGVRPYLSMYADSSVG